MSEAYRELTFEELLKVNGGAMLTMNGRVGIVAVASEVDEDKEEETETGTDTTTEVETNTTVKTDTSDAGEDKEPYIVKGGDTLADIVRENIPGLTDKQIAEKVDEITKKNGIENKDFIYTGDKLDLGGDSETGNGNVVWDPLGVNTVTTIDSVLFIDFVPKKY